MLHGILEVGVPSPELAGRMLGSHVVQVALLDGQVGGHLVVAVSVAYLAL